MTSVSSSPVVDWTWRKRHESQVAGRLLSSSILGIVLLFIIYLDINFKTVSSIFDIDHWLLHSIELATGLILTIKIIFNTLSMVYFLWTYLFGGPIDLTEGQRRLLGVKENEHGFRTPPPQLSWSALASPDTSLVFSTSQGSFSGTDGSPHSSMVSTPHGSPQSMVATPHGSPHHSFVSTPLTSMRPLSPGFASPVSLSPHHGNPYSPSASPFSGSFNNSLDMHHSFNTSAPSPYYDQGNGSFRNRRSYSAPRSASTSPYSQITDRSTLQTFLQEQEEKELRSKQVAQDSLNASSSSFWSYGSSALDLTHTLRKYTYQLASHLPQSFTTTSAADLALMSGVDEVWSRYGVTEDDLYKWTEKLRKWLSATIVTRLNKKIGDVNKQLRRIGSDDMQIGEIGISTLKQVAMTKGSMVPSLNTVVPYLEFFANQEYLVHRIRDLNTGSMSEFSWNKGGDYGKPWAEHLITDASLVMYLLCTYLDSRLPTQPRHMDGKVFTSEHFVKTPDTPDFERKDNLLIYQTGINPPHFQVVIGTETYNLPKGRNNMFQAVLLFFYHIRTREQGMLGRINLGLSGLNLLWMFD